MKANWHPQILQVFESQGLGFECVSRGEVEHVLATFKGIDRKRILFTPNFAPRAEYEWAVEQGIWVTLDNLHPLKKWPELFKGRELFVRIDTGQGRGHHDKVRTAGVHSKFGVPLFEVEELERLVKAAGAKIVGLHAHTGSGVFTRRQLAVGGRHADCADEAILPTCARSTSAADSACRSVSASRASCCRSSARRSPRSRLRIRSWRCGSSRAAISSRKPACCWPRSRS